MGEEEGTAVNNPVGIHAGVWIGQWTSESTRWAIDQTLAAGFDLIEITATDVDSIDAAAVARAIQKTKLSCSVSLGLTFDADVSSEDSQIRARGATRLHHALRLAQKVGSRQLVGVLYSALGKYQGPASERSWRNSAAAIRELAVEARAAGIELALEVVNRYETNLFNEVFGALRFLDEVGEENVRIHLDTYHMNIEEPDFALPVAAAGDRLGYVHVGESHRGYLGAGNIRWAEFFRFESFSNTVVDPALSNTLAVWRNLWTDNADLAAQARASIRAHLGAAYRARARGQAARDDGQQSADGETN
jgi:D-psicose/D-tagatose/L-ribulose 3-epimerase